MTFMEWQKQIGAKNLFSDRMAYKAYQDMRRSQPLRPGDCSNCQKRTETLAPFVVEVCKACAERFARNGAVILGKKRFLRKTVECAWCDRKLSPVPPVPATLYNVNVGLCYRCISRFDPKGRRTHIS